MQNIHHAIYKFYPLPLPIEHCMTRNNKCEFGKCALKYKSNFKGVTKNKKADCGHDRVSVMGQFKGSGTGILTCRF